MIAFLCSLYLLAIFLWCGEKQTPSNKYLLESKEGQKFKKKICECALDFDQL